MDPTTPSKQLQPRQQYFSNTVADEALTGFLAAEDTLARKSYASRVATDKGPFLTAFRGLFGGDKAASGGSVANSAQLTLQEKATIVQDMVVSHEIVACVCVWRLLF